jgi:hypothetical protein
MILIAIVNDVYDDDVIDRDDCDDDYDYYEDFECVSTSNKKSAIYYKFNDLK